MAGVIYHDYDTRAPGAFGDVRSPASRRTKLPCGDALPKKGPLPLLFEPKAPLKLRAEGGPVDELHLEVDSHAGGVVGRVCCILLYLAIFCYIFAMFLLDFAAGGH